VHTLAFLDPGHFHAALTLRERHPRVRDEIAVYAPDGAELRDFLALVDAFNRRPERPTAWRPVVRAGADSLARLIADRPGDAVVLAGRTAGKMALIRRLHDAGFHVLADKPWLANPEDLDDLRSTLRGGPVAAEIMTGRHEIASILVRRLVADREVFGGFAAGAVDPAIEIASVHHLEKTVNGAPLRRPAWFFDVRVQGDGVSDLPTHMVDQVQGLVRSAGAGAPPLELIAARRWATPVPRAIFARVTGEADFPSDLRHAVRDSALGYLGNAAVRFRAGAVVAALETRWDLSEPAGGGDTHRTVVRGERATIRVELSAATGFRRRIQLEPRGEAKPVGAALERAIERLQEHHPGVAVAPAESGWEIRIPRALDTGHESHFPLVLDGFLALAESGGAPASLVRDTLAKYELLARAMEAARAG